MRSICLRSLFWRTNSASRSSLGRSSISVSISSSRVSTDISSGMKRSATVRHSRNARAGREISGGISPETSSCAHGLGADRVSGAARDQEPLADEQGQLDRAEVERRRVASSPLSRMNVLSLNGSIFGGWRSPQGVGDGQWVNAETLGQQLGFGPRRLVLDHDPDRARRPAPTRRSTRHRRDAIACLLDRRAQCASSNSSLGRVPSVGLARCLEVTATGMIPSRVARARSPLGRGRRRPSGASIQVYRRGGRCRSSCQRGLPRLGSALSNPGPRHARLHRPPSRPRPWGQGVGSVPRWCSSSEGVGHPNGILATFLGPQRDSNPAFPRARPTRRRTRPGARAAPRGPRRPGRGSR